MTKRGRKPETDVPLDPVLAASLNLRAAHAAGQLTTRLQEIRTYLAEERDPIVLATAKAEIQRELTALDHPDPGAMASAVVDRSTRHQLPMNGRGPQSRPQIDAGDRDLERITAQAWDAVRKANDPPRLFRVGTQASLLVDVTDSTPMTQPLTIDRLRHALARMAEFYVHTGNGGRRAQIPPEHLVRDMLADADPPLPRLERIVSAPFFTADGVLVTRPGHDRSGIYYEPSSGLERMPDVAVTPTAEDCRRAKALLVDELLCDFPFVSAADRAHAVALLLAPFVRDLIKGPTPLHLVDKPAPGTGAGLLCTVLLLPALRRPPAMMTAARDEDESRKRIFAALISGLPIVLIDNVRRRLDSEALSSALTAVEIRDRPMGLSHVVTVANRSIWVANGNNVALSNELARRTLRIRLDAMLDQPAERPASTFKHHPLDKWAIEHRGDLVWAALTLVQAWLVAGRPSGKTSLGSFEAYSQVVGGILQHADIDGFLDNMHELYEQSDAEGAESRRLLAAWWDRHGSNEVMVRDLLEIATDDRVGLILDGKNEQAQKVQLGQRLASLRDRHFRITVASGEMVYVRLAQAGSSQRARLWQLLPSGVSAGKDSHRLTALTSPEGNLVSPVSLGESNPASKAGHAEGCTCPICVPPGTEDFTFPGVAEPMA